MKRVIFLLFVAMLVFPEVFSQPSNTLTPKEKKHGWILLFDGKSSKGWTTTCGRSVPDAIWNNRRPNCDIETDPKCVVGMLLSNTEWRVGHDLKTDPMNGHILEDKKAEKIWELEYEKGWDPKV